MKPTIQILSENAINKIAAGEVIESPASVVKELVENAIDAGATRIDVEIVGGGLKKIKVVDDGVGMHREDASLAILRHATSKIRSADDLFSLATKGFRGEALASIGAVSTMVLQTAHEEHPGTKIEVVGGTVGKKGMCARTRGTTIEVSSLFYNVPARKKFQKSAQALSGEIFRLMTSLSLSHPEVGFTLTSNGKRSLTALPLGDLESRAADLLGGDFLGGSFPIQIEESGFMLKGFLGAPHQSKPNKMSQYLFLNRRAVFSPVISEAVRDGYGTRMEERRHPLFLLHVELPPASIDVNVHPQKLEVRLSDEVKVRQQVMEAVASSFAREATPAAAFSFTPTEAIAVSAPGLQEEEVEYVASFPMEKPVDVVGVVGPYLVMRGEGMQLVDLRLAEERIWFERLLKSSGEKMAEQGLLIPLELTLTPVEGAMLLTHQGAIEDLGFRIRMLDEERFAVEAIPPFVSEGQVQGLLEEMTEELQTLVGVPRYEEKRKEKLALLLSRYAKKGRGYTTEEGVRLYQELKQCNDPSHSPKGAKTEVDIGYDTIKRLFAEN